MGAYPILRRELTSKLRSPVVFAAMLAVLLTTSIAVLLRWPTDAVADVLSVRSIEVFRPLVYCLAVAVMTLVPAFPGTSLVKERNGHTLPLLMLSPLGPASIYLGKFLGSLLMTVVLLSASLPAVAASNSMGGLSLSGQILPLYLLLMLMAIQYTAVALWVSSHARTSDWSLRWSYAAVLALAVLTLAPKLLWGGLADWRGLAAEAMQLASPIPALQKITHNPAAFAASGSSTAWELQGFMTATILIAIPLALLTMIRLRPAAAERVRDAGKVTDDQSLATRLFRRLIFLVDPKRRTLSLPTFINPVMVKEFRTRRFGRAHWLLRLVATCAVASLTLAVFAVSGAVDWGVQRVSGALVMFQLILLLLIGPALASGLIAGERESGGWPILRLTPLSPARIVSGKIFSVLWTLVLVLMATLPAYLVMVAVDARMLPQVQRVAICLAVTALMVLTVSVAVSSFMKDTAAAISTSYVLLLTLFAGTLIVWSLRDRPFSDKIVEQVLKLNPTGAALSEMRTPGFEAYELIPEAWWFGLGISFVAFLVLCLQTWRLCRPE